MSHILPELLKRTAATMPEKTAVIFKNEQLTYAALDTLSNQLANALKALGVRRGDRVGIYLNKSLQSIISIYGILKADAVYVPLDPLAPAKRLGYIVQNCGIECLISHGEKTGGILQMQELGCPLRKVILLSDEATNQLLGSTDIMDWAAVRRLPSACPELKTIETDLAYILYTSGSTGDPKGVMISHLNAMTFINWAHDCFGVTSDDRLSNHAPLHFDLSIFDIFVSAKAGAAVAPVPMDIAKFPVMLAEFIETTAISVWYSVPSALMLLLARGQIHKRDMSKLRLILFAGEVFPTRYLRELMQAVPNAAYFNLYGPTETNVITYYHVPSAPEGNEPIPIGKACENMEVFALDDNGRLVAEPGQQGELYGRGSGVAQGYWRDAEKTACLFVANPLQPNYLDRTYRTGDLVRLDESGNYHYLGRRDHQVKVQGYRIELGEIEAALYNHPEVSEAAVVAMQNEEQTTYLKAFVVLRNANGRSAVEIKRHCAKYVPKYMIPEIVEFRDALPKTSTGKTDKKQLAQA